MFTSALWVVGRGLRATRPYYPSRRMMLIRSFSYSPTILNSKVKKSDDQGTVNDSKAPSDINRKEASSEDSSSPTREESATGSSEIKKSVQNALDELQPYLNKLQDQYETTKKQVNDFVVPVKFHFNKAKEAIKEANEKLDQQELESKNYDFNQDLTDNGTQNQKIIKGLPSERERNRKLWRKKLDFYIDSLQETIFTATRALNDVTGYSSIQKLRQSIEVLEKELEEIKEQTRNSKEVYGDAISKRLEVQKEVNELLQRKNSWTPVDLEKFTKLYQEDKESAKNEEISKHKMEEDDAKEEELQNKLTKAILTRYHEEQIWSDKIRRTSTWGTFGLMGINILLFLVFQLALEPWKRKRLVGSFEEKVQHVLEENSSLQNEKLDLMNLKVEELRQNKGGVDLLQNLLPADLIDDHDFIEPPSIIALPSPPQYQESYKDLITSRLRAFKSQLITPYNLLFFKECSEANLSKHELISATGSAFLIGLTVGGILLELLN